MASINTTQLRALVLNIEDLTNHFGMILRTSDNQNLISDFHTSIKSLTSQVSGPDNHIRNANGLVQILIKFSEYYREQVESEDRQNLNSIIQKCFLEIAVCSNILERSFVNSMGRGGFDKISKRLILRMDECLTEARKKNISLINYRASDIKRQTDNFFSNLGFDDNESEDKQSCERNSAGLRRIAELEMKLMTKDTLLDDYTEEVEKLNQELREMKRANNQVSQNELEEIYMEVEGLNKTIELLKSENVRLRAALGIPGNEDPHQSQAKNQKLRIEEIEGLKDKLSNLEQKLGGNGMKAKSRAMKAEEEIIALNRRILDMEDEVRKASVEKESVIEDRVKINLELKRVAGTYEELKSKSLELIKRMTQAENENSSLRNEKNGLVENILNLQRSHQEELQSLRDSLEHLTEKMYILNLEHEQKTTVLELENKFDKEKEEYRNEIYRLKEAKESVEETLRKTEEKLKSQEDIIFDLSESEKQYFKLKEVHSTLKSELDAAHNNSDLDKKEIQILIKKAEDANTRMKNLENERAQARGECGEISKERSKLQTDYNQKLREIQDLNRKICELELEIENEKKRVAEGEEVKKEFELESEKHNEILKLSKNEITELNQNIDKKNKEIEQLEKDRLFFKKKVERLEDQLFAREKSFVRIEAEKDMNTDEEMGRLTMENQQLKEEVIILERVNMRLHKQIDNARIGNDEIGIAKLSKENERIVEMFKKSELDWLKEKQALLNEIDFLKDQRQIPTCSKSIVQSRQKHSGYLSVRPERDDNHNAARFLSTYASTASKISKGPKLLDSTASKSRLH